MHSTVYIASTGKFWVSDLHLDPLLSPVEVIFINESMSMSPQKISVIPVCPHCKLDNYTYINSRTWGWWKPIYNSDGKFDSSDNDGLRSSSSKVIRCATCKEIRKDLVVSLNNDGIVVVVVANKGKGEK